MGFTFKTFEQVIITALLWNTPIFENSVGSDLAICLHVDIKISFEMFVVTPIFDTDSNLYPVNVTCDNVGSIYVPCV